MDLNVVACETRRLAGAYLVLFNGSLKTGIGRTDVENSRGERVVRLFRTSIFINSLD